MQKGTASGRLCALVSEDQVGLGQGGAESPHPPQDGPGPRGPQGQAPSSQPSFHGPHWSCQVGCARPSRVALGKDRRLPGGQNLSGRKEKEVHRTRACLNNEQLPHLTLHTVLCPASFSPQLCSHEYKVTNKFMHFRFCLCPQTRLDVP